MSVEANVAVVIVAAIMIAFL